MAAMKRFYSTADVAEADGGYTITLDGKMVRTPSGRTLTVANVALAEAIAAEWLAQEGTVRPDHMPLTQLASTAMDRVGPNRQTVIDQLLNYAGTDLLCYRAESPRDLVERQENVWQPVVDWAAVSLGAELVVTTGVVPVAQPDSTLVTLRRLIDGYDDLRLTALQSAVAAMGSLLLGVALVEGRLGADEAFAASQLDETYQSELWGEDPEAMRARTALRNDVAAARRFLELSVRGSPLMRH